MHGPHQVAQKLTSTTWPRYFDQSKAPPPSTFPSIFISWPTRLSRRTTPSSTLANSASLVFLLAEKTLASLVYVVIANSLSPLTSASIAGRVRQGEIGRLRRRLFEELDRLLDRLLHFRTPRHHRLAQVDLQHESADLPGELFMPALLQFGDKVGKLLGLLQHVHLCLHGELHLLIAWLGREDLFGGLQDGLPQLLQPVPIVRRRRRDELRDVRDQFLRRALGHHERVGLFRRRLLAGRFIVGGLLGCGRPAFGFSTGVGFCSAANAGQATAAAINVTTSQTPFLARNMSHSSVRM